MASFVKSVQEAFAPMFRPAGTLIEGVNPSSWASPNNPIRPTAQLATGVRTWDFRPGINLNFTPRGDSPITFQQLNNVANSFDLCRLIIERRKNQVVNRPWVIRVKTQPGELKAQRLKREGTTPNVARVSKLLRFPDGYHPFDKWIRMWLEDLLVYDAPVISPVQNMLGDVMALRTISGTTITPLVDQQGFVPMPPSPARPWGGRTIRSQCAGTASGSVGGWRRSIFSIRASGERRLRGGGTFWGRRWIFPALRF